MLFLLQMTKEVQMITYELLRAKLAAKNILKKDLMERTGISR